MLYRVIFKSRYYPSDSPMKKFVRAASRKEIRDNWPRIIQSDEYHIVSIEEVCRG